MIIANVAIRGMNRYRTKARNWLENRRPDIVTIQKIGLNEEFCAKTFQRVGYKCSFLGNRSGRYPTGVAVLHRRVSG